MPVGVGAADTETGVGVVVGVVFLDMLLFFSLFSGPLLLVVWLFFSVVGVQCC